MKKYTFSVFLIFLIWSNIVWSSDKDALLHPDLRDIDPCAEGYVDLSLTVVDNKAVDPKIIESHPKGTFDKDAMRSIYYTHFEASDDTYIPRYRIVYDLGYDPEDCAKKEPKDQTKDTEGSAKLKHMEDRPLFNLVPDIRARGNIIGSPMAEFVRPKDVPDCVEGWVLLGFDVSEEGEVVNVHVVDADPEKVFDEAAIETFQRFRLPKIAGYKGVKYLVKYPPSPQSDCD